MSTESPIQPEDSAEPYVSPEGFEGFSVKVANYKSFSDDPQGFDCIKLFNVVIGRNNSGKSSLIDIVCAITAGKCEFPKHLWHQQGTAPCLIAEAPLSEASVRQAFSETRSGGGIPRSQNHYQFGQQYIGAYAKWNIGTDKLGEKFISYVTLSSGFDPLAEISNRTNFDTRLAEVCRNPFRLKQVRRLSAERDLLREESSPPLAVEENGIGATNLIQNVINNVKFNSEIVEKDLLRSINEVFNPDTHFTKIVCQQDDDGFWELYLEEEAKGRIAISESGSGLKTIILALANIHLMPCLEGKDVKSYVFCFEELENNLHPALLRRLFAYLLSFAKEKKCLFFITTHSSVAIDLLSKEQDCQIVHVTQENNVSTCNTVATYIDNCGVLDDLDVRASDLLQSNGVIWVEGPSDRVYINKWISLYSHGKLTEGLHYQCVFYGGRLLSHLAASDPDDCEKSISLLLMNRNCCVVIDSDRKNDLAPLNATKKRIIKEVEKNDGIAWVTMGREIEHYLTADAISRELSVDDVEQVEQFENFRKYMAKQDEEEKSSYFRSKAVFSEQVTRHLNAETAFEILDLRLRIKAICEQIEKWNGLND